MPLPSRLVSVSRLREAAAARVAASSRRAIARETGIPVRSVELFLAGSKPHPRTLNKLLAWYAEQIEESEGPPISPQAAVRALVHAFPAQARARAAERLSAAVRQLHDEAGLPCPPGLDQGSDEPGTPVPG
jgi:hypothetical protein